MLIRTLHEPYTLHTVLSHSSTLTLRPAVVQRRYTSIRSDTEFVLEEQHPLKKEMFEYRSPNRLRISHEKRKQARAKGAAWIGLHIVRLAERFVEFHEDKRVIEYCSEYCSSRLFGLYWRPSTGHITERGGKCYVLLL